MFVVVYIITKHFTLLYYNNCYMERKETWIHGVFDFKMRLNYEQISTLKICNFEYKVYSILQSKIHETSVPFRE